MITLVPPSRRSVLRAVACATAAPARWVYLGVSVRTMETVASRLGPKLQQIVLSDLLQETAGSLRSAYIEYIGKLGVERDSPDWWFSSLYEKRPTELRCNAFRHICYVAVAVDLCRRHKDAETLVLVVEAPEVRRGIAAYLQESGARFAEVPESRALCLVATVRDWAEMLARRAYWIGRQSTRMVVARALGFSAGVMNGPPGGESRPLVLLHNWINNSRFTAEGAYRDAYFGPLREELQKRGLPVAVVAEVLSHDASYRRILGRLKRSGIPMLVPEAALTLRALFRWIGSLPLRPPQRRAWPRFHGFDISDILARGERQDWVNPHASVVRMISDVVSQWRRRLDARAFIDTYEGQTWERGYCKAFREYFPQTCVIGYQHGLVLPMWLSFFLSPAEWGKAPLPDRIVTTGQYHYELLRRNGVPERMLVCGSDIRILDDAMGKAVFLPGRDRGDLSVIRVLVTLPVIAAQAAELLLAALKAFADPQAFRVTLKFHPNFPPQYVKKEAGVRSYPAHVSVEEKPLSDLLRDADVLVYTYSAAALEALAYGVPIVHFASTCDIDLDPLAGFDGIRVSAGTVDGLREAVHAVVKVGPEEHAERVKRWQKVVNMLLPPPDEKTIDLFMPENVR